jgi:4-amino-4-deoxy-L-arabinose transferase-like glycosyltransferase
MLNETHSDDRGIGRGTWWIVIGVTIARVVYLVAFCPYELAVDEAQYWDWSRPHHLSLSYVTKGPGIAWLIAASTRLLGNAEWAIRLPAALSTGVTMLALAALANRVGGRSAARLAVLAFCCIPVFSGTALLMTIDAPFIACWVLACLTAWSLREHATMGNWLALAVCLAAGFLFKYTILLLLPGLLIWFWLESDSPRVTARTITRLALATALFALLVSPVVLWNVRYGWPTLAHTLGHVSVVGPRHYDPRWTLELLGAQIGLVGPVLVLIVLSLMNARKNRAIDPGGWRVARFALATASPILLFYLAVSFLTRAEGNWPIAGYTTLLIPVALHVARGMSRSVWRWSLAYGAAAFVALFSMQWLEEVPYLTRAIPYHRVSGHQAFARRVDAAKKASGAFLVTSHYSDAALLAYYIPDHPPVRSASFFLEGRLTSYDFFEDTSLHDRALLGGSAVLIGATAEQWSRAFRFDSVQQSSVPGSQKPELLFGTNYNGVGARSAGH